MAVIGGFRSDVSLTRKSDGNFGNVSAGVFPKWRINENGGRGSALSTPRRNCVTVGIGLVKFLFLKFLIVSV